MRHKEPFVQRLYRSQSHLLLRTGPYLPQAKNITNHQKRCAPHALERCNNEVFWTVSRKVELSDMAEQKQGGHGAI